MNNDDKENLVGTFDAVCGAILFSFAKHDCNIKNSILSNFVARTDKMLKAILLLWKNEDYQDCWILFRCLLDRLFHINYISENDDFEIFDDWSFFQQCKANNKIASDILFKQQTQSEYIILSKDEKERFKRLSESPPKWVRPYPETVAKEMGLKFLYTYGYDYGSTHVHPMANDGLEDFYTITKLKPKTDFPNQKLIFSNSVLVASLIIQEIINSSDFKWKAVVYNFLENVRKYVGREDEDSFKIDYIKFACLFKDSDLCEKNE